jgi:hypothetical protein
LGIVAPPRDRSANGREPVMLIVAWFVAEKDVKSNIATEGPPGWFMLVPVNEIPGPVTASVSVLNEIAPDETLTVPIELNANGSSWPRAAGVAASNMAAMAAAARACVIDCALMLLIPGPMRPAWS